MTIFRVKSDTYLNDSNTNANSTQSSHVSFNDFFELGQATVGMNDFGDLISSHGEDTFSATFDVRQTAGIWHRLGLGGESRVFPIQVFLSTTAFQLEKGNGNFFIGSVKGDKRTTFIYLVLNNVPGFSHSFIAVLSVILQSFLHIRFNDASNLEIRKLATHEIQ